MMTLYFRVSESIVFLDASSNRFELWVRVCGTLEERAPNGLSHRVALDLFGKA
jgi:hypothetical protein